ncbi:MAG: HAMP domain-containing histidine kinase [Candidatus Binataceae bacterium]|nr:HAMP domain-containing histidine kinase [Candidatus Binataceae bacterium]
MKRIIPAFGLKAKLMALMVLLLTMTLGAQVLVSLGTQEAVVESTQEQVKDLARAIQISVQELTSVSPVNPDQLPNYVKKLRTKGLQVSIASSQNLIINSTDPKLIGAALTRGSAADRIQHEDSGGLIDVIPLAFGTGGRQTTVYLIPVEVEDHLMGYVQLVANFGDFAVTLQEYRNQLLSIALGIFAVGLAFAWVLAQRYVEPIHTVASAAQNFAARGLEPVPETRRGDEIGLLTRSFNEMVAQLRRAREREIELNRLERFAALGQLAGSLAHEIKNPLNFISLALDQLRAHYAAQLSNDRDHFLHQIAMMKDEIRRLAELIQSFLHYGKPIEIHPAPTDVRALVHGVLDFSESKVRSQGITVHEDDPEVPAVLHVDAEKLRTCFINVVANAIQAMPDGGELRVGYQRTPGTLQVIFEDSGVGIDPAAAQRIFEPFFTTKREGIGLGLFLSQAIVEKHGGKITIGPNDSGRGTRVVFTFPLQIGKA